MDKYVARVATTHVTRVMPTWQSTRHVDKICVDVSSEALTEMHRDGRNALCPPSRRRRPHVARSRGTPPGDAVALRAATFLSKTQMLPLPNTLDTPLAGMEACHGDGPGCSASAPFERVGGSVMAF